MLPTAKFRRCDAVTSAWEGGYANHPKDPGGPTDRGVTQATYHRWLALQGLPPKPVKGISAAEAERVFFDLYWQELKAESLAVGVDLATYDAGVNSGPGRARTWLMASIGGPDGETVKKICARRLSFVQSLKIWEIFGKGWGRRIADVQAKGVAWALAAANDAHVAAGQLQDEAAAKSRTASKQTRTAAGGTVSGGGAIAADQAQHLTDWLLTGVGALVVIAALYLATRAILNRQQAAAYAREAYAVMGPT